MLVTERPLAKALPFTIGPVIVIFPVPARVSFTAAVDAELIVRPANCKVFPAPVEVNVCPVVAVFVTAPMAKVVPVPAKVTVRPALVVTAPVPRLRLFVAVLAEVPKAILPPRVSALFLVLVTAEPEVLLTVPAVRITVPVPRAVALFTLSVPLVKVTPPVAAVLSPLRVSDPAAAFIVVRPE